MFKAITPSGTVSQFSKSIDSFCLNAKGPFCKLLPRAQPTSFPLAISELGIKKQSCLLCLKILKILSVEFFSIRGQPRLEFSAGRTQWEVNVHFSELQSLWGIKVSAVCHWCLRRRQSVHSETQQTQQKAGFLICYLLSLGGGWSDHHIFHKWLTKLTPSSPQHPRHT